MNIYQENILDHYKHSPYRGELTDATTTVVARNPLCGDRLEMQMKVGEATLRQYRFTGEGCAISLAAASMLGELVEGKSLAEINKIRDDDLLITLGVPLSPARTKCALLAFSGLRQALSTTS